MIQTLGFWWNIAYEEEDKERAKEARGKARRQEEERKREKEDRKRTEKGQKKERKRKEREKRSRSGLGCFVILSLLWLRYGSPHRSHISKELKLKAERKDEGGRKNERNRMQREKKEAGGQIYLPRKKGDAFSFSGQASIPNPFSPKSFTSIDDQLVVGSSSTWSSSPFWATCESKKLTHTWPSLKYWNPKSNGCENQFTPWFHDIIWYNGHELSYSNLGYPESNPTKGIFCPVSSQSRLRRDKQRLGLPRPTSPVA